MMHPMLDSQVLTMLNCQLSNNKSTLLAISEGLPMENAWMVAPSTSARLLRTEDVRQQARTTSASDTTDDIIRPV